ncbi:MAG: type II toxin-antitoxin system VapC family toxin [Candidatus Cloacimonadota bacterium]|nr:MAG: type II toxin-antitoxin system VapC family toxin [Candidatus Cloacimonadota bacterium]
MKPTLIDTDILSLFFRGDKKVIQSFHNYLKKHDSVNISIITYYEILSGLKYRDLKKLLMPFLEFVEHCNIIPLTPNSVEISADIYSDLRKKGLLIDDIDILIAGISISNDMILITHNIKHFSRIENLVVQDWAS